MSDWAVLGSAIAVLIVSAFVHKMPVDLEAVERRYKESLAATQADLLRRQVKHLGYAWAGSLATACMVGLICLWAEFSALFGDAFRLQWGAPAVHPSLLLGLPLAAILAGVAEILSLRTMRLERRVLSNAEPLKQYLLLFAKCSVGIVCIMGSVAVLLISFAL